MHIEVTGTDSYAGVDCYVIESRVNETRTQETCTQQAFSSAPYVAFYDENGNLEQRIELVEYERVTSGSTMPLSFALFPTNHIRVPIA